jgi:D-3-phosphoglycerate dehydrogenase
MPESAGRDISIERSRLPPRAAIRRFTWTGDPDTLAAACADAHAVLTDYVPFTRDILLRLPDLKIISVAATGWDCVDVEAAADLGISVASAGEYCTDEVADHAMALLLALNRKLRAYDRQVQARRSWRWNEVGGIRPLKEQTLGLIGFGRVGRGVARRALGFGLEVIAFDPALHADSPPPRGVRSASMQALLAESHIISLHCPLTPDTAGILDATAFAQMRRQPSLINVARGGLIVERDLVEALDTGRVSGAALDVLAENSPKLEKHPLRGRDDVILTPHVAFYSDTALETVSRMSADNIRFFLAGDFNKVDRFVHHAIR